MHTLRLAPLVVVLVIGASLLVSGDAVAATDLAAACPAGRVSEDGFADVAEDGTHEDAIDCVVWWQVASGETVDRFVPDNHTSRAQLASFLVRLLDRSGDPLPPATADHFDDDEGSVHESAIDALAEADLVHGTSPRRYSPGSPVTRGQMASFLVAVAEHRTGETLPRGGDHFDDDDGSVHEAAIDAAVEAGIATGYGDGTFRPEAPVTRAEMASFLARVLDRFVAAGASTVPPADPVVIAVGDIGVCGYDRDEATAALASGLRGTILALGDLAYENGTTREFSDCWGTSWGPLEPRIRPVPGNHDYGTAGAGPYYDRFGDAAGTRGQGWYAFDAGAWHVVALNSNCDVVGCGPDSPQARWLEADLAAAGDRPVVAYWHHARFSSGPHGSDPSAATLWGILDDHGADVVLQGHEHDYERLDPVDPSGDPTADGIRSFVVGTGGAWLRAFPRDPLAATAVRSADSHGVLVVTLGADHYSWEFVPVDADGFTDRGRAALRGR